MSQGKGFIPILRIPVLDVPALKLSVKLSKLISKPIKEYNYHYVYNAVRSTARVALGGSTQVSCFCEFNKEQNQWQGRLRYHGKYYDWIVRQ